MQDRQEQLAQIYHDLRVYLKQQGMEEPIVCGDGAVQAWMFMLGEAPVRKKCGKAGRLWEKQERIWMHFCCRRALSGNRFSLATW